MSTIAELKERMYSLFVKGETGFDDCINELRKYDNPPIDLVNLSISSITATNATNVCAVVVKAAKNWDDDEKSVSFEKMRPLFEIFAEEYCRPVLYQYACAVWISIGQTRANEITFVIDQILKGLTYHEEVRCRAYGVCLLSEMVKELPSINNFVMPELLMFWDSETEAVAYQVTRYLMHAAMSESERKSVFYATNHAIEKKLKSPFPCIVSSTLGLMQNLMVDSPFRIAYFKTFRPIVEKLEVEGVALSRKNACLEMMQPSWIPALTLALAVFIGLVLLLRGGQAPPLKVFETTPLR